jgi:hypothetical protein
MSGFFYGDVHIFSAFFPAWHRQTLHLVAALHWVHETTHWPKRPGHGLCNVRCKKGATGC